MIDFKKVKLIIWDLDETLWEGTLSDNESIKLHSEFVQFINDSLDRGIVHSICSKNDFDFTKQKLVSLNLWELFVFPSIDWTAKGERIKSIISQMKLRAENVLFVDDNTSNLQEANFYCPELQICTPPQLKESINSINEITKVDVTRPRLKQYRLIEEKSNVEKTFSSNEEFLMACNIRVDFHTDCIDNIDRIHDLIMRSNQLNYTKFRQDKDLLLADLSLPDVDAAYITVSDSFGDYGIVGFYMIVGGTVKHYLFSCRTLGMLVEQYVYMKIGCPDICVQGDVITQLNNTDIPKWINREQTENDNKKAKQGTAGQKVLFKGPCDISQIFSFLTESSEITAEFTYINDAGISVEGYNHTSQIVTSLVYDDKTKTKVLNDTHWLDEKMLDATSWQSNDAIVFSMLTDGNLGIYEHKETGCQIALCEKHYDLTNKKNWEDYINKRIFTSLIDFHEEDLIDFADKFKYIDNGEGDLTLHNLDILYKYKQKHCKLILLLGSEKPFEGETKPSYIDRHIFHEELNNKIKAWAADKSDVILIEINQYITSQKDYVDTINHFQKRVYYHIAQDLLKILSNNSSPLKIRSKGFLYLTSAKNTIKQFLKKILKRS